MALQARDRRRTARTLNRVIDNALNEPSHTHRLEVLSLRSARQPAPLAERIRRRATVLARQRRHAGGEILTARDELILAVYAAAAPPGWSSAWCDGSWIEWQDEAYAGIGVVLMEPGGSVVTQISQPIEAEDAFATETAALIATLEATREQGIERLRVYTDCTGLALLWRTHRQDPRLAPVRARARRLRAFELRDVPRLHNQVADRLAKEAVRAATDNRPAPG